MDLLTIIQIVLRRWYVAVPVLLMTVGFAYYVQLSTPPQYETTGSVLLEEPRYDPSRLPEWFVNPRAIVHQFERSDAGASLSSGDTQVVPLIHDASMLEVAATGSDAEDTEASVRATVEWIATQVEEIQDERDVAGSERIQANVATPVIEAQPQPGGSYRATGIVVLRDPLMGVENPYSEKSHTNSLLRTVVTSDTGREQVNGETAAGVDYQVESSQDNPAIIRVMTYGPNPQDVLDAFDVVRDALASELDMRQARAEVPDSRRIIVTDLARPEEVVDVSPPLNRAVAALIGVGAILAVVLSIAIESITSRRRDPGSLNHDRGLQWSFEPTKATQTEPDRRHKAASRSESGAGPKEVP